MKTTTYYTDNKCVISLRIDKKMAKRVERAAKRMQSSKSSFVRLALDKILEEADQGRIFLSPIIDK